MARQRRHVGLLHLIEHGLAKRLARDERQRSGLLHLAGGALERLARFVMRQAAQGALEFRHVHKSHVRGLRELLPHGGRLRLPGGGHAGRGRLAGGGEVVKRQVALGQQCIQRLACRTRAAGGLGAACGQPQRGQQRRSQSAGGLRADGLCAGAGVRGGRAV